MIYETFREKNSELRDKRLIIGVSGGVDSIVLLHLCYRLGAEITVVHVNYGLRGQDSDADQIFTSEYCDSIGVSCKITHVNADNLKAKGINLQQKAREIRYQAYVDCMQSTQGDYILTAHHLDDSIETVVMNFFRGTDLKGLTGISDRDCFRRPLLSFTKSEIMDYAQANDIKYRDDKSNATDNYTRNVIRNTLLPQLEDTFPNINKRLATTIENLSATQYSHQTAMDYLVSQYVKPSQTEELLPFDTLEPNLEEQVLIYWGGKYGLSRAQMQNLYTIKDRVGKKVNSENWQIAIDREGFLLSQNEEGLNLPSIEIPGKGFTLALPNQGYSISDEHSDVSTRLDFIELDADQLSFPLLVRYWEPGDKITFSLSPKQSKKLKKLFNDHKVKATQKYKTPILVNGDGEIIWVIGLQKNPFYLGEGGYLLSVIK